MHIAVARAAAATVLVGAWAGAPLAADKVTFPPDQNGAVTFVMPSRNIECIYIPEGGTKVYKSKDGGAELSCDRAKPAYVRVQLGANGAALVIRNPGDASCCGASNVLDYGRSWTMGPFSCESSARGLTCKRADGRGFLLNRSAASRL